MATNNTYQFISEKCTYEEGASISVSQLNKALKAYIKERYEMKQTPKDTINISNLMLVDTPVVAEVVDTPAPSMINPVEASNIKVSEVPNVDESIVVEPMIADSA
ncbi:hypothetical protein F444_07706, partial [Phytophthora nicotianae P1976]